ncbi:serine hydrolase domain-containing protein [Nocardiopsis nanhaiensis]
MTRARTGSVRPAIDREHWRGRLAELAERHGVPGAQLGVLRVGSGGGGTGEEEGELVQVEHGVLNSGTGHAVTPESVFQIGSITKVWTATVVMGLVDEGALTLDTRIAEVLPELRLSDPDLTAAVTVRHLLNHTSGIDGDLFTDTGRGDDVLERYVTELAEAVAIHPLGSAFSYCNSGFPLLGRVIEKLTGLTWDRAMRERLFTPLGLTRSGTLPEEALLHGAAVGHIEGLPEPVRAPVWGLPRSMGPAGLVTANAEDVLRFAEAHLRGGVARDGNRILAEETAEAMTRFQVGLPDRHTLGDSWGLGWIRFDWNGHRLIGHDGGTIGQSAYLRVLPEAGLAVVLLTNGGRTGDLFQELFGEVFRELADVRIQDPLMPPEIAPAVDVTPHLGAYESAVLRAEVFRYEGETVLRTTDLGPMADFTAEPVKEYGLAPVGPGQYAIRPEGEQTWRSVRFHRLDTGEEYLFLGGRSMPRAGAGAHEPPAHPQDRSGGPRTL